MANHYEVLEVSKTATAKEIKKAYYRLAKKYHPDHNQNDSAAAEKFKAVGEAYRVLSNAASRAEYDELLASGGTAPKASSGGTSAARGQGPAVKKPQPKPRGAAAGKVDFQNLSANFASFFGFNPKSKEVTDENQLNTYVPKGAKRNPLDASDMFEQFLGLKK